MKDNKVFFDIPEKMAICEQHNDNCLDCNAWVDKCILTELIKMHINGFIHCNNCQHAVFQDGKMVCQSYISIDDEQILVRIEPTDGCIRGVLK